MKSNEKLILSHVVRTEAGQRAFDDRRKRVTRTIASYRDAAGHEYRKSFEARGNPHVPSQGTHEELNALQVQY